MRGKGWRRVGGGSIGRVGGSKEAREKRRVEAEGGPASGKVSVSGKGTERRRNEVWLLVGHGAQQTVVVLR